MIKLSKLKINKKVLLLLLLLVASTYFGFNWLASAKAEIVIDGWCVYYKPISVGGGVNWGDITSENICKQKPGWALFCQHLPLVFGDPIVYRDQNNCNCINDLPTDINESLPSLLTEEKRQQLIESCGWWDFFQTDEGKLYLAGSHASGCRQNCGGSCSLTNESQLTRLNNPLYGKEKIYRGYFNLSRGQEIDNSFSFIQESYKQNDRILEMPQCLLPQLPEGCRVSATFRSGSDSTCVGESPSQHCSGNAIDISCGEAGNGASSCHTKTQQVLDIMSKYWRKEIIRECSVEEIRRYRLNSDNPSVPVPGNLNQIIHIDTRNPSIRTDQGI